MEVNQDNRTWKPLDVGGLRLYLVRKFFAGRPEWTREFVVAAKSPRQAADIVRERDGEAIYQDGATPLFEGCASSAFVPGKARASPPFSGSGMIQATNGHFSLPAVSVDNRRYWK